MQAWFSVHYNGSTHQPHQHEDASAAAVMYLDTPEGSGPISFFDPRTGDTWYNGQSEAGRQKLKQAPQSGSIFTPPFHRPYVVMPRKGDLVIFAGYVNHAVGLGTNT